MLLSEDSLDTDAKKGKKTGSGSGSKEKALDKEVGKEKKTTKEDSLDAAETKKRKGGSNEGYLEANTKSSDSKLAVSQEEDHRDEKKEKKPQSPKSKYPSIEKTAGKKKTLVKASKTPVRKEVKKLDVRPGDSPKKKKKLTTTSAEDSIDEELKARKQTSKTREDSIDEELKAKKRTSKTREDSIDEELKAMKQTSKTREDSIDEELKARKRTSNSHEDSIDEELKARKRISTIYDELKRRRRTSTSQIRSIYRIRPSDSGTAARDRRLRVIYHEIARPDQQRRSSSVSYISGEYKPKYKGDGAEVVRKAEKPKPFKILAAAIVALAVVIVGLITLAQYTLSIRLVRQIERPTIFCRETARKRLFVMTDHLDCSLLVKEASIYGLSTHLQLLTGVACLSLVAPYSVAYDSSQSLLYHVSQRRKSASISYGDGHLKKECQRPGRHSKQQCNPKNYLSRVNGFVDLNTTFQNSVIMDPWKEAEINVSMVKSFLYRIEESKTERVLEMPERLRQFINASLHYKKEIPETVASDFGYKNADSYMKSSRITLSSKWISRVLDRFFNSTVTSGTDVWHHLKIILPTFEHQREDEELSIHIPYRLRQPTSSIFTAFIVYTVFYAFDGRITRNEDAELHKLVVYAQALAYEMFSSSREWNGNLKAPSLLDPSVLKHAAEQLSRILYDGSNLPTSSVRMNRSERVASMLYWDRGELETLALMNFGLPPFFQSGNWFAERESLPTFHVRSGNVTRRSLPVSSAAGAFIMTRTIGSASLEPIMAVTASGSLRTVEAVSTTILRMLLLDLGPGEAICCPSAFYDYRDGQVYCDEDVKRWKSIPCKVIPKDDLEAQDRVIMAVRKRNNQTRLIAATDSRDRSFNYAVGY
ncbi:hypothetical protein Q1695_012336 [Nippostrongylus brasiliensis]|nr:hypothetical protein Q1695_012336 [Nippostrongylus brasiliensis]